MIDDGELDWKVIAIRTDDPLASQLHDISDVEKNMKGYVSGNSSDLPLSPLLTLLSPPFERYSRMVSLV